MRLSIKAYLNKLDFKTKILIKNATLSFAIKGLGMFISLYTMPAYIRFFDNKVILGMWFTAISMLSWILTFDLGIGNGLRNHLVKPIVDKDEKEIKKYISSAYISISFVVVGIIIASYFIIPIINWNLVFNISSEIITEDTLLFMVRILFCGIMINFLLKLISSIFYALQKSVLPSILTLSTSIILLIYITVVKNNDIDYNIRSLSVINALATNIPFLIATIILFRNKFKNCKPSFKFYSIEYSFKILKLGGIFFWVQIMTMIMFGTNEFLISWLVRPEEVVNFQIYNKIFMIICTLFNLALTPVWSAVREAYVINDIKWINSLYKKLNLCLLIVIPFQLLLIIFLQKIINIWLGNNSIEINLIYAIIFSVYNIIYMKVSIDTSIVAGLGNLKIQSIALTVATGLKIFLAIIMINIFNNWIYIIIANIFALIPYIIIENFDIRKQISYKKGDR